MVTTSNADEDNFNQIQGAYNACMAETEIQKLGITPIQTLLGDLSKLLAVNDSAYGNSVPIQSQDSDGISEAILFLEKLDIPSLLNFGVGADDKDPVCGRFKLCPKLSHAQSLNYGARQV